MTAAICSGSSLPSPSTPESFTARSSLSPCCPRSPPSLSPTSRLLSFDSLPPLLSRRSTPMFVSRCLVGGTGDGGGGGGEALFLDARSAEGDVSRDNGGALVGGVDSRAAAGAAAAVEEAGSPGTASA